MMEWSCLGLRTTAGGPSVFLRDSQTHRQTPHRINGLRHSHRYLHYRQRLLFSIFMLFRRTRRNFLIIFINGKLTRQPSLKQMFTYREYPTGCSRRFQRRPLTGNHEHNISNPSFDCWQTMWEWLGGNPRSLHSPLKVQAADGQGRGRQILLRASERTSLETEALVNLTSITLSKHRWTSRSLLHNSLLPPEIQWNRSA